MAELIKVPPLLQRDLDESLSFIYLFFPYQGIYARHLLGNASAPNAAQFGQCVELLAKVALQLAQRYVGC